MSHFGGICKNDQETPVGFEENWMSFRRPGYEEEINYYIDASEEDEGVNVLKLGLLHVKGLIQEWSFEEPVSDVGLFDRSMMMKIVQALEEALQA